MMGYQLNRVFNKLQSMFSRRYSALGLIGLVLMMPVSACGQGERKMGKGIVLNVEMISYIDRPVFDIVFNGTGLGVMDNYGATGTITGVDIPFGMQALKWKLDGPEGTPGNGDVVTMKNQIFIFPEKIPRGTRYLGLHLYPDNIVEMIFSESIPDISARGKKILATRR